MNPTDETFERIPVQADASGVVRVSGTRVSLDTVVDVFEAGATPEEIVLQYPPLVLAEVYAVIAYYLRHRAEVAAYLTHRRREADQVRRENERRFDPSGVRDRLLARRR